MKKVLFVLVLLGLVLAQESLLGCTITDTQVVCPKVMEVMGAQIELKQDFTCGGLGFDFEFEDLGCYGQASVINDMAFESCQVVAPLSLGGELDYDRVNWNKNCVMKKWGAGSEVTVLIERKYLGACQKIEGDEFYQYDKCKSKGKKLAVTGFVTEEEGIRYLEVSEATEKKFLFNTYLLGGVVALALVVLWFFVLRKKK